MKAMMRMRMRKALTITSCTLVESSLMPSSEICVFCLLFDFMYITLPDYKSTHCYHYYIKGKFIAFYLIYARSWVRKVEASHSVQTDSTHRASGQSSPTNPNVLSPSCHIRRHKIRARDLLFTIVFLWEFFAGHSGGKYIALSLPTVGRVAETTVKVTERIKNKLRIN